MGTLGHLEQPGEESDDGKYDIFWSTHTIFWLVGSTEVENGPPIKIKLPTATS